MNSSLKHHDHDLEENSKFTPFLVDFLINPWSFRGVLLVLTLGCLGTPLIKPSSYLAKVCSDLLLNFKFTIVSGLFSWSSDHPMFSYPAPSDLPVVFQVTTGSSCGFLKWPPDHPVVFSSNHRIILCMSEKYMFLTNLSGDTLKWSSDHPALDPQDSQRNTCSWLTCPVILSSDHRTIRCADRIIRWYWPDHPVLQNFCILCLSLLPLLIETTS